MIKLIELFAGIGTQAMTLKNRFGDDVELVDAVEWDKKSVDLYNAIHKTNHTTSDAQNVRGTRFPIEHNGKDIFVMTCSNREKEILEKLNNNDYESNMPSSKINYNSKNYVQSLNNDYHTKNEPYYNHINSYHQAP